MIHFSSDKQVAELTPIDEIQGKLSTQFIEDKLMHSVLEGDKDKIDDGKLVSDAINFNISSFTPDIMMQGLVSNYKYAEKLYGKRILRILSGFDPDYVERNIRLPEFQKEMKQRINESLRRLKKEGIITKDNSLTRKALELASIVMYIEEIENLIPKGIVGERYNKEKDLYGEKDAIKSYHKGDRYRDIAIKASIRQAIRRSHPRLEKDDMKSYERQSKGHSYIIYALDSSGSMKGRKIEHAKKAGIALAFKAIDEGDKVGLIVFGKEVKDFVQPTDDFGKILDSITSIRPASETDLVSTIRKAVELFPSETCTKHLIFLTDALPTIGEDPHRVTLEAVSLARANGITISLIGISLDKKGKKLAEEITQLGEGRLYIVKDLEEMDSIILQDYYATKGP
ncbi:VWA domain-containing protein [Candidatus Woesearchaeota archaeon]|nr:VWA domain-containing protein [Candidatus Woesearchaeota archaeon]